MIFVPRRKADVGLKSPVREERKDVVLAAVNVVIRPPNLILSGSVAAWPLLTPGKKLKKGLTRGEADAGVLTS
jgi:hypothetical protein